MSLHSIIFKCISMISKEVYRVIIIVVKNENLSQGQLHANAL